LTLDNINVTAPVNPLGYGQVGLNFLKALDAEGVRVSFWPIGPIRVDNQEDSDIINRTQKNTEFFDHCAPSLRIWHQHDMAQHVGHGMHVGMPIFELDRFNDIEHNHLESLDQVIVNSQWAKGVVEKELKVTENNGPQTDVVPLGIDPAIFNMKETGVARPNDATVFLNIGKWEKRKGHDCLPAIFNKAFKPTDNVELWMMNDSPFIDATQRAKWERLYTNTPMGEKVRFIPRVNSHKDVADIMKLADCGIFPSRAEGWNLEALEMMACGKDIILSDCTAHREYAEEKDLVPMGPLEDANDGVWFNGQGQWCSIDDEQVEDFAYRMRSIHSLKEMLGLEPNWNGANVAKEFTWRHAAKKLIGAISSVYET